MNPPATARRARRFWPLAIAALAVAAVCAVAAVRPWTADPGAVVATGRDAVAAVAGPLPLALPEQPRVLIFGDSWTYGSAASLPSLGYAYVIGQRLGWDTTVDGVRGSGYLKPGLDGGSYGQRIAALDPALDPDLVLMEGSINDRRLPESGYREAVTAAWDALAALYPEASVVILGPAPQVLPVETATARIDADLADLAAARSWWYISPIADGWITTENYAEVIDTAIGRDHPSTDGHAYLATRLAEALAGLGEGTDAAADGPRRPDPIGP
ncbi:MULTISPECIES: SGNH/GDSL hydrolase family protein [unclassified Microbacterium]|uniref:SGNH/GDSL hydrolase family protein n=1 Tax=unclassified Microbacterium TaxID=2609290 RepID=UPI00214AF041|nr:MULTISPECIES: SGNH/GDSL hydrolase family protein [unclassified Microbacterium]MCR2810151.1 SGNH/GDSL hydrolase family protein [Microbacterium sp. zg.B185]WIM20013.1 SGNH/GDSL hydrolase family protein [Microbacterium sp. zg-B185]